MAIGFNVKWIGLKSYQRHMQKASQKFAGELQKNLRKAGEIVIGESKKQFEGSRTRAVRKGRAITAPRKKLAVDYGTYRRSISQDPRRVGRNRWTTEIGPTVKYARVHEMGLRGMPKRQILTPGVKQSEAQVIRILGTTFKVV